MSVMEVGDANPMQGLGFMLHCEGRKGKNLEEKKGEEPWHVPPPGREVPPLACSPRPSGSPVMHPIPVP
jgi:hypothetical protein